MTLVAVYDLSVPPTSDDVATILALADAERRCRRPDSMHAAGDGLGGALGSIEEKGVAA